MIGTPTNFKEFQVVVPVINYLKRGPNRPTPVVEYWQYPSRQETYDLDGGISVLHVFHSHRCDFEGKPAPNLPGGLPMLVPITKDDLDDDSQVYLPQLEYGWTFTELVDILPEERIKQNIPLSDDIYVDTFRKECSSEEFFAGQEEDSEEKDDD